MPTTHIQVGALASANGKHGLHRDPGLRDRVAVNGLLVFGGLHSGIFGYGHRHLEL